MPLVSTKANAGAFGLGWSAVLPTEELGGMVLIEPTSIAYTGTSASIGANGSVEFTAVSSLSLNGVFDATYDNYQIVYRGLASTDATFYARFRTSGSDATGANYTHQYIYALNSTVAGARTTSDTKARVAYVSPNQRHGFTFNVFGPYLAQPTAGRSVTALDFIFTGGPAYIDDNAMTHSLSTSYDGITLYPASGNITGLVSVYGLVGA